MAMELAKRTRAVLSDTLMLASVPARFIADLYGGADDDRTATPCAASGVDELDMELDADEAEPCVEAANVEIIMELNDLLQRWCTRENTEEFWALFSTHDAQVCADEASRSAAGTEYVLITVRQLIALLNKLIGLADPYSIHHTTRGLHATVAYLRLLRVKGSRAYGGFSSLAIQAIVRFLNEYPKLLGCSNISELSFANDEGSAYDSRNEMELVDRRTPARQTRKSVARVFEVVLKELELLASNISLREFHDEALRIAEFFAEITSIVCKLKKFEDKPTLERCMSLACRGLTALLSSRHGRILEILSRTFRTLVSNILMLHSTKPGSYLSADKDSVRSSKLAVNFVKSTLYNLALIEGGAASQADISLVSIHNSSANENPLRLGVVLLQQICIQVPERAEFRCRAAEAVRDILGALPKESQAEFMAWMQKYSRNSKSAYRAFALDIIAALIGDIDHTNVEESAILDEDGEEEAALAHPALAMSVAGLLLVLAGRGTDKSPTVRSRAVGVLAKIVEKGVTDGESRAGQLAVTLLNDLKRVLPTSITVSQMIINRSEDEKSAVRRSTLSLIKALLNLEIHLIHRNVEGSGKVVFLPLSGNLLDCLSNRTRDTVANVRKSTITVLTDLVEVCPEFNELWNLWLDNVPPAALDQELSVQEEAAACAYRLFLNPLQPGNRTYCKKMLRAVDGLDEGINGYFRKLIFLGCQKRQISSAATQFLQKLALDDMNMQGPWRLLAAISGACFDALDYAGLLRAWKLLEKGDLNNANWRVCSYLLEVIGILRRKISESEAKDLQGQLVEKLANFEICPTLISATISTIHKLDVSEGGAAWRTLLLERCEEFLTRSVLQNSSGEERMKVQAHVERYLHTATAVAQLSPNEIPEKLVIAMEALVASDAEADNIVPSVRAQAFVSLGKLCLQNEDYAKRLVSAFARELETSKDAVVRNNVMVILCDLCTRYTRLVDPYIPKVACCLRDESMLVRRQTLAMLTRLLQEDYAKWKGTLFFKFVSMVVDDNEDIVEFAEFCLCHVLQAKYPNMFFNFFVDTILFLNGCTDRVMAISSSQQDRELFAMIGGGENTIKRRKVYVFLLRNIVEEQRFQLTAKLCTDILGAVVDDTLDISDPNKAAVLVDALFVLSSKEIKISIKPPKDAGDGSEMDEAVNVLAARATTKILSKISRKNAIENILPVIIELKRRFEHQRSSLLRHLMVCLREIVKDFRVEMEDICAGDRRLANELEFDLRRFEEQEHLEKQQQQQQQQQHQVRQDVQHLQQELQDRPAGQAQDAVVVEVPSPCALSRRQTVLDSPKGERDALSAQCKFKTPLPKMLFIAAGSHANRTTAFSVPRLQTLTRKAARLESPLRRVQASTPSAQGPQANKADVSRMLDLSGFGDAITPIRGVRRDTFASVTVGTPLKSVIVDDENDGGTAPDNSQPRPRVAIPYTPVRTGKARVTATPGWNVNSPMPSRAINLKKRRSASSDSEKSQF